MKKGLILSGLLILICTQSLNAQSTGFEPLLKVEHPEEDAFFGFQVTINNDWAFISAPYQTIDEHIMAGAVYVYRKAGNDWNYTQTLVPDSLITYNQYGISISSQDNWLAVGALGTYDQIELNGQIKMYKNEGNGWVYHSHLDAELTNKFDFIGRAIDMNDNYLIAGGGNSNREDVKGGTATIFQLIEDNWVFMQELHPGFNAHNYNFGWSVAISDLNELAVGAPKASVADSSSGAVYMYKLTHDNWEPTSTITSTEPQFREYFGEDVDLHNGTLIVGAPGTIIDERSTGSAYIYQKAGNSWVFANQISPDFPQSNLKFGAQVSIHEGIAAVSARMLNRNDQRGVGGAYIYHLEDGSVANEALLTADSPQAYGFFGSSVALSSDYLVVGAHLHDNSKTNAGSSYFYQNSAIFTSLRNHNTDIPNKTGLSQNYPNPFNPSTVITYQLPVNSEVRLEVFDMLGRRVALLVNEQVQAGVHTVNFDASHLASGVYIYRMVAGEQTFTKKLTLIK